MSDPAVDGRARLSLLSNRLLHLIIMPTEQCQFRCLYCYEDFGHGRMNDRAVQGLKSLMARRARDLDLLSIEWFGGEPLLAYDIVEQVQASALALAAEHPALQLQSSMTTNGALLDRNRLAKLVALGVKRFQVSLDGPQEIHDRFRITAGGHGTFERIWGNLVAAREVAGDFQFHLRLHVSRSNLDALKKFIVKCNETFGQDHRFRLALRGLRRLGSKQDAKLPVLDDGEQSKALAGLSELTSGMDIGLHRGPFERANPAVGCYAAAAYSLVVRSNGDLAKCTVALRHPHNRVGRLLKNGTVDLDRELMLGWMRGAFTGSEQDLKCPAVSFADDPAAEPWEIGISEELLG